MARKSKYDTMIKPKLDIIEGWARNGLTLDDIAHNLGVGKTTFFKYIKTKQELKIALDNGKEVADIRVENALYRKATGYFSKEQKIVQVRNSDGSTTHEVIEYDKWNEPDTTAMIFWLKNRKPESWRDKVEIGDTTGEQMMLMIGEVNDSSVAAATKTSGVSRKT